LAKASEFFVEPQRAAEERSCRFAWNAVRHIIAALGHERVPAFIKNAIAVTESPGRVSMRSMPEQIPVEACGVLTVISANLWHDYPRYKNLAERLESFAGLIESESVDVILLQEVARTSAIKVDDWLSRRLQMAYVYSRANGSEKIGFEEGLSVFSRFPLRRLPYLRQMGNRCNPFVRRLALGVEVDTPCGEILAFSVHLALGRRQNALQLRELHQWIGEIAAGRSVVIGGDFNAPEHTHQIHHVRTHWQDTYRSIHTHGHSATHEIRWLWGGALISQRLDYIFLQAGIPQWRVADVQHVDSPDGPHSDHRAVLARLAPVHTAV